MKPYQQIILFVAIGVAEYSLSWLNHKINLSVLSRKKNLAAWQDLIANTLSEIIPFVIYVSTQNWIFMIPRIIGNTIGTRVVAGRKLVKKKSVYRKKHPFTSA
jgi:hypothetical protein